MAWKFFLLFYSSGVICPNGMGSKDRGDEQMETLSVENPLQEFGCKVSKEILW